MINGILNIYKEKGYTSHDVVARLRGILGQKKIGHTGTLDPAAEGVLPVCLGRATKVCGLLTDKDKIYETVLLLGKTTDTQDITGTILKEKRTDGLTEERIRECILSFTGLYGQIPPMYSALKVDGKKLYELAREGKTVERKSRTVTIYNIQIREISLPRVRMEVHCSKGTYIRTLCHDIGEKLGTGGCMEALLRTRTGRFPLSESVRLSEVEKAVTEGKLGEILFPLDEVFPEMEKIYVKDAFIHLAYNGNPLSPGQTVMKGNAETDERFRIYDEKGRFIGVYRFDARQKKLLPEKMFLDPETLE